MIQWSHKDIEVILKSSFTKLDCEMGFDLHELQCEFGGLQYLLTICPKTELVWLRADINDPNSARPQFEYSLRSNRIRISPADNDTQVILFDFVDDSKTTEKSSPIRLAIHRLTDDKLYIWSVTGESDPVFITKKTNEASSKETQ